MYTIMIIVEGRDLSISFCCIIYICIYIYMYVCMYVCVYIYIYIYISSLVHIGK